MNPEQAWQSVLGQLQVEMPKASFDTWVRDTQVVSCDDSHMVIGTYNGYARDWLDSRLASTVSRLLVGVLNRTVEVEFVVMEPPAAEKSEDESAEEGLAVEQADKTRYQLEVQPDRVVVFPGYTLRLLEQGDMTPIEMSLYISFRQGVYFSWKNGQGNLRAIPSREIIRFANMSRATFFREIKKRTVEGGREYLAGGMVEVVPEPIGPGYHPGLTDRRYANANRYRVQMRPRLTRRDCAVIEKLLYAEAARAVTKTEAHDLVLACLADLASRKPDSYLDQPVDAGDRWPRDLLVVVRRVLDIEVDLPEDLADAAERATDHILSSYGNVVLTHYFLCRAAPVLGLTHPKAWAIIMLRDRCWYNYDTRVQHNFAIVPGGIDALADWVGVTRKAVTGWMADPVFSAFVRQADLSLMKDLPEDWQESRTAVFLVSLEEPELPRTEEDDKDGTLSLEKVRLHLSGKNETLSVEKMRPYFSGKSETRNPRKKRDPSSEKMRPHPGKSATLFRKECDSTLEEMRQHLGKSETRLNNLIKPLLNPSKHQESPSTPVKGKGRRAVGNQVYWDFDFLASSFAINPKSRGRLLGVCKTHGITLTELSRSLAAWLLYTHSIQGARIENPVAVAVARVRENAPPPNGFEMLAALRPGELKAIFVRDLDGRKLPATPEADLYAVYFGEVPAEHKRQLELMLFG